MARITNAEYQALKAMEQLSLNRVDEYNTFKNNSEIPDPFSTDYHDAERSAEYLKELFFDNGFNIMDVVVGERGYGPASQSDTHFRGRVLETALDGSFDGKPMSDFGYAELKLIETKSLHQLTQVMTCGAIFKAIDKKAGDYIIDMDYTKSKFYDKMERAIIVSYLKEGKQLGFTPNNVILFDIMNPLWADKLEEDWISIRDEMVQSINEYKAGIRSRKASGICKSDSDGRRRPNGYLGIRSDGIVFTPKFFEIVSKYSSVL